MSDANMVNDSASVVSHQMGISNMLSMGNRSMISSLQSSLMLSVSQSSISQQI